MAEDHFVDAETEQQDGHSISGAVEDKKSHCHASSDNEQKPTVQDHHHHHHLGNFSQKIKHLLHLEHNDHHADKRQADDAGISVTLADNAAFSKHATKEDKPRRNTLRRSVRRKAKKAKVFTKSVAHPIEAVKHKIVSEVAVGEQPYLSEPADKALLDAHEELVWIDENEDERAIRGAKSKKIALRGKIDDLERRREAVGVAWLSSRFLRRARVVDYEAFKSPKLADYRKAQSNGEVRTDWLTYFGQKLLYASHGYTAQYVDDMDGNLPPFDHEVFIQYVERLVMATAPWQEFYISLRGLARWDDPRRTAKWFALWLVVWYSNMTFSFIWTYLIFIVMKERIGPKNLELLKESHARAKDRDATAHRFGELIKKHGNGGWADPLMERLGPYAQIQLGDLADWLEMLKNFYEWRDPRKTGETLFFWMSCVVLGAFANTHFVMRLVTFMVILWFFVSRPIASRYPTYRHVVSPFMWVWWDIPNQAEYSFRFLRHNAQLARETVIENNISHKDGSEHTTISPNKLVGDDQTGSSDSLIEDFQSASSETPLALEDTNFISFKCHWDGSDGDLKIFSSGVRFVARLTSKTLWEQPFSDLAELRKADNLPMTIGKTACIEIRYRDGSAYRLESFTERDEAVNAIIGFSAMRWQVVQPKAEMVAGKRDVLKRPKRKVAEFVEMLT